MFKSIMIQVSGPYTLTLVVYPELLGQFRILIKSVLWGVQGILLDLICIYDSRKMMGVITLTVGIMAIPVQMVKPHNRLSRPNPAR